MLPLIIGAVLITTGCSSEKHETATSGVPLTVKGVQLEQVQTRDVAERQEAVGTVKAVTSVVLAARIAGTITSMNVKAGDRVKKGETLVVLEANETLAGSAAAEAGVEESRRAIDEAKSRKKLADATFQRYQKLFSEQAVTRQEFENKQTEQEVASQGVLRAESRLIQARESARAASVMSGYAKLVSPLNGVVTQKSVDRGTTVFTGTPILEIEEESGYRLEVQVPETIKGRIAAGQSLEIALDGQPSQAGKIAEIAPVVDPGSRSFTVKIAISGKGLRSGAYGRAFFPIGTGKVMLIPKTAVLERGNLTSVWVVDCNNIARMRLVKPGKSYADRVEILSGITSGERVVVSGVEKVTDGAKVE
jgi:RND family efflux transporter MFP subunit